MLLVCRRSAFRTVMFVAVGLFSFLSAPQAARAEEKVPQISAAEAAVTGARLETERKWRDAIEHYKHSLESWPKDENLKYGLRRAQFQFGIDRRYSDQSFLTTLKPMSRDAALAAFDEIMGHIRAHFVDSIDTTSIVAHGTESLWLALRTTNASSSRTCSEQSRPASTPSAKCCGNATGTNLSPATPTPGA